MRLPCLLLTILPLIPYTYADGAAAFTLSLTNVLYSTYWAFTSPSHLAVNTGSVNFTIANSAIDNGIPCYGVNSNSWAVFYPSTVYQCDVPDAGSKGVGKREAKRNGENTVRGENLVEQDPYCWANSASFTLDTTTFSARNLSVSMSWTCEKYVLLFYLSAFLSCFVSVGMSEKLTRCSEGVYSLTLWSLVDLDCEQWNCENDLWPVGDIFQKVTGVCKPVDVHFQSTEMAVMKLDV
jgi:hypothetical protein